jgi:hypothetical protein
MPRTHLPNLASQTSHLNTPTSLSSTTNAAPTDSSPELRLRDVAFLDKTCASDSPMTCQENSGCYTWREANVQGCCDTRLPASACDIATTCVPSSAARALAGSEPLHVVWCTASTAPYCAEYRYSYNGSMIATQHLCDSVAYTSIMYPTPVMSPNGTSKPTITSTVSPGRPSGPPDSTPSGSIPTGKLVAEDIQSHG